MFRPDPLRAATPSGRPPPGGPLVTALEEVPLAPPEAIVSRREGRQQPVHAVDQVRVGRFQGHMKVIRKHDKRVHPPAVADDRFTQCPLEGARRRDGREHRVGVPVIAAVDDVISRPGKLES